MKRLHEKNINSLAYWNKRHSEADHLWNPENIVDRVASHLRPGESVLDVGGGDNLRRPFVDATAKPLPDGRRSPVFVILL